MKKLLLAMFSAVVLSASAGVAGAAPFPSCFRGDVMDSDGGHTGALGAPECYAPYAGRIGSIYRSAPMNGFYGDYNQYAD